MTQQKVDPIVEGNVLCVKYMNIPFHTIPGAFDDYGNPLNLSGYLFGDRDYHVREREYVYKGFQTEEKRSARIISEYDLLYSDNWQWQIPVYSKLFAELIKLSDNDINSEVSKEYYLYFKDKEELSLEEYEYCVKSNNCLDGFKIIVENLKWLNQYKENVKLLDSKNKPIELSMLKVGDKFITAEDWHEDYDWLVFYEVLEISSTGRMLCLKPSGYSDYMFLKMQVIKK